MTGLILAGVIVGLLLLAVRVHRYHREVRILSAQLMADQRIELLTRATLRAMRETALRRH